MSKEKGSSTKTAEHDKKHAHTVGHVVVHATPVCTEIISERAYQLFERRGCVHGFDVQDWIEAEKQLMEEVLN
jgi:hypothetical protein